jgi:hypothetical protein
VLRFREETSGLQYEDAYMHNCVGITADGQLINMINYTNLRQMARDLRNAGATRALVLDNGGSSSVFYFDNLPPDSASVVQIIAGPNYRPRGTAYIFIVLSSGTYEMRRFA